MARISRVVVLAAPLTLLVAAYAIGRPMRSEQPLDISHNGVHAPYNVHNKKGELMFYNFRAVQPGLLYRGSGFIRNRWLDKEKKVVPAAFADQQAFNFLRARNIRRVVRMQAPTDFKRPGDFYAEPGYFDYWAKKTGYKIEVIELPVRAGHGYDSDPEPLKKYPLNEQRTGLKAASEFIGFMKTHKKEDGAVYIHCDAGKDRTGVAVAAYELWRNRGTIPADQLWNQVMERYTVSNTLIRREPEAGKFAGDKASCKDGTSGWVCGEWMEKLRPQLETIAQL